MSNMFKDISRRKNLQHKFLNRKKPGDLLVYVNRDRYGKFDVNKFIYDNYIERGDNFLEDKGFIKQSIKNYLIQFRNKLNNERYYLPDDSIPCIYPHYDIGLQTAAMTGLEPKFSGGSWWLEQNLNWREIKRLSFNSENKWIKLALYIYQALWFFWKNDFFTLPFIHRSPLDAANGIRGNMLFLEMYEEPEKVKWLINWCVNWQLKAENYFYKNVKWKNNWGNGVMGTWLPDKSVWINGDPITLISRKMMLEFDKPFTGRLFSTTGGGFFHNHTRGIYQVDQVAEIEGIRVQHFDKDPNCPTLEDTLINEAEKRDKIIRSSIKTPIFIAKMKPDIIDVLLPILSKGRFILDIICKDKDKQKINKLINKIKCISNLI